MYFICLLTALVTTGSGHSNSVSTQTMQTSTRANLGNVHAHMSLHESVIALRKALETDRKGEQDTLHYVSQFKGKGVHLSLLCSIKEVGT